MIISKKGGQGPQSRCNVEIQALIPIFTTGERSTMPGIHTGLMLKYKTWPQFPKER
jgi:hypothetical protein